MIVLPAIKNLIKRLNALYRGKMTGEEFFCTYADRICEALFRRSPHLLARRHYRLASGKSSLPIIKSNDSYHIGDVRLPLLDYRGERILYNTVWEDTYWSYLHCNDEYSEAIFDMCDKFLREGLYGLVNDSVNVTVMPGDIVIDAGSWIGDFAAYASVKGATVYAFEPSKENYRGLERTAELNGNITPVNKGLSDSNMSMDIHILPDHLSASSFMEFHSGTHSEQAETVRLDDFVRENNLPRVDFIKADIEGFERHMLAGAQETLARFAPKLALCTYHLPDDPQVMAELIKQANPKYNIVQKRCKLFASVPE